MNDQQARAKAYGYAALALRQFVENGGVEEELWGNSSRQELYFSQPTEDERRTYDALLRACESVLEELDQLSKG